MHIDAVLCTLFDMRFHFAKINCGKEFCADFIVRIPISTRSHTLHPYPNPIPANLSVIRAVKVSRFDIYNCTVV